MKVVFSGPGEADLESIGDEIARDNPRRSHTFVRELRAVALSIVRYPRRFPVAFDGSEPLRRAVHGNYLIFYVIRADHIHISRILHSARLIDADLFS